MKQPCRFDFWSQRDLHMIRPAPARIAKPNVSDRLLFVPEDALLIASLGQFSEGALFGRVAIASSEIVGAALTQHILRVYVSPGTSFQLYAFLSTRIGLQLLRTTAIGNSIPMMRLDLVRNLPAPALEESVAKRVDNHIKQGLEARVNFIRAEKEAVRIIEEEVLPEWLA
jgi:type I restriction enzyme S subunit